MYGTDKIGDIDDNEIDVMFSESELCTLDRSRNPPLTFSRVSQIPMFVSFARSSHVAARTNEERIGLTDSSGRYDQVMGLIHLTQIMVNEFKKRNSGQ